MVQNPGPPPFSDLVSAICVIVCVMSYPRAWQKCRNKIQQYTSLPTQQWNHYQLLGYLLSKITQKFEALDISRLDAHYRTQNETNPSKHPMIESMRYILRQFNKSPEQAKVFLDWCLAKHGHKLNTAGLRWLLRALPPGATTACRYSAQE